jgi:F-type H+-transporting ATPase subunit b
MSISLDITFLIQLINFFISLLIIHSLIIKPIRGVIARRKSIIDADNKDTENFTQSMKDHNLQYEERLNAVRSKIAEERDAYKKSAEDAARGVLGKANDEARVIRQESTQKIQSESREALQALQANVSAFSKEALAKILA